MMTELEPELQLLPTDARPPKVLLVDDDDTQTDVLQDRLTRQGFVTYVAHAGHEALDLARRHHPHVVLLDLGLPDVSGLSVCEELSDAPETCDIPVIVVSALDGSDIVRRTRAAGGRFYVHKPYDPNVLLTLIENAVRSDEWT